MFHEKGFRGLGSGFNKMTDIQIQSTITCPQCNGKTIEQMPTDYCQYFWECPHCKNNLKPKKMIVVFIAPMELIHAHQNRFKIE